MTCHWMLLAFSSIRTARASSRGCWETLVHEDDHNLAYGEFLELPYVRCCHHPPGHSHYKASCFDDEFSYERCCNFKHGPSVRLLPALWTPVLTLEYRKHLLTISQDLSTEDPCCGSDHICALRTDNVARAFLIGNVFVDKPRLVLDLSAGVGLTATAASLSGHSVVAVENCSRMLRQASLNIEAAGVRDKILLEQFDVCDGTEAFKQVVGMSGSARFDLVVWEPAAHANFACGLRLGVDLLRVGGIFIISAALLKQFDLKEVLSGHQSELILMSSLSVQSLGWGNPNAPTSPLHMLSRLQGNLVSVDSEHRTSYPVIPQGHKAHAMDRSHTLIFTWSNRPDYEIVWNITRRYCELWQYNCTCFTKRYLNASYKPHWERYVVLQEVFQDKDVQTAVWMDDDSFIYDFDTPVETWLERYAGSDLIIGKVMRPDPSKRFGPNTGAMIFRNTAFTKYLLGKIVHGDYCRRFWKWTGGDQFCLRYLVNFAGYGYFLDHFGAVPTTIFNCQDEAVHDMGGRCEPWIFHTMANKKCLLPVARKFIEMGYSKFDFRQACDKHAPAI